MAVSAPTPTAGRLVAAQSEAAARARSGGPGTPLLAALVLAVAYAAFAHGATGIGDQGRLQAGIALIATGAVAVWLFDSRRRLAAPVLAWVGIGLLGAFAVWSGVSLAWSIAPDRTWIELNYALSYALVALLALAAGSWQRRALRQLARGYLIVALLVAAYALGGKLVPWLHLDGLVDLDHTRHFSRLRAPLQYWNALALFCVLAVPIALRYAVDVRERRSMRLAGLVALQILLVTIGFTYSRGGIVALVVAVTATLVLAGARLRSLLMLAIAAAAAAPALTVGFTNPDLTHNGVSLSTRTTAGAGLAVTLGLACVGLLLAGRAAIGLETRVAIGRERAEQIGRGLAGALAAAVVVGLILMAVSSRGLFGTIGHEWHAFKSPKVENQYDPARLLSTNSGNRWVWWSEAVGAWSRRPIEGWGAGSFPVLHLEYRTNRLEVLQPHSVPLQLLAETGLVGALLALGAIVALLAAALGVVRRLVPGSERGTAAALFAGSLAWAVHGLFDWDWDIPAVTLPAILFLGVLAGNGGFQLGALRPAGSRLLSEPARAVALALATLLMLAVALSALVPVWAEGRDRAALHELATASGERELQHAQRDAELAAKLNPLAVEPLFTAASVASDRGMTAVAYGYLVDAVRRQPDSTATWGGLAGFYALHGDLGALRIAAARALALDPRNAYVRSLAESAQEVAAPPAGSATATGTPLPQFVQAPVTTAVPTLGTAPPPWQLGVPCGSSGAPASAGAPASTPPAGAPGSGCAAGSTAQAQSAP
jgi:hypothetical protein